MSEAAQSSRDELHESVIKAAPLPDEYRSMWTDLRGVSFSQGFLDVKGVRIRYIRSGDPKAPKVVMLPGTGGHAETYVANIGPLGEAFDCWSIDVPGSGYSEKNLPSYDAKHHGKFLKDFAEVVGADKLNLVGCSVGSWTALRTAFDYPELVNRVVLGSPSGGPIPEESDPWYKRWTTGEQLKGQNLRVEVAKAPSWEVAQKILQSLMPDPKHVCDDMVAARVHVNQQPGAAEIVEKVYWWSDTKVRYENALTRDQLRQVKTPILGICEAEDGQLPLVRAMFSCLPNSRLVRIEGVGHWPHYEAPKEFNKLALDHFTA